MKKDLLTLWDLEADEIFALLEEAQAEKQSPHLAQPLAGKNLALIFEKASTRTKVSFTVAAYQLGAGVVTMNSESSQLSRGETYADTARVLSQYVDGIVLRTFAQQNAQEMAAHATIPVINGLSDLYHPCQVLADLLTVLEEKGTLDGLKIAWIGDGNNMAHSWIVAAAKLGFELHIATPKGHEPSDAVRKLAAPFTDKIKLGHEAAAAAAGADVINTDTWLSMGQEGQGGLRPLFEPFQVNEALLKQAAQDAIVLHCLPAHRGDEITDAVMDGQASRVWQQAGNRLHVQKIILKWFLGKG